MQNSSNTHFPVMLSNVLEYIKPLQNKIIIDATFGRGGYSRVFLEQGASVIAFDRDPDVYPVAEGFKQEFQERFTFYLAPFSEINHYITPQHADAIIFDIGVSSPQLDNAQRGFSFKAEGPLDMRMSKTGKTAADLINNLNEKELANLFYLYGEEQQSRKIARIICNIRHNTPITTTTQLSEIIARIKGYHKKNRIHPATKVFQALRIVVNDELNEFAHALEQTKTALKTDGHLICVTFHSLEDRIIKNFLRDHSSKKRKPRYVKDENKDENYEQKPFEILTKKPILPSEDEIKNNPRARSAKLRAALKL